MTAGNIPNLNLVDSNKLVEFFTEKFSLNPDLDSNRFIELIKKFVNVQNDSNSDTETLKNFLDWVKTKSYLKINSAPISDKIIAEKNNDCILHDIKVMSRGPDDLIFDKHPDVRAKIARGNTILEQTKKGKKSYDLVIYALRKVTGGLGDEDELDRNANDWRNYFLKSIDETKYVLSLQKANGESAHMSCRWIGNDYLIFAGSKNNHLAFRNKEDIFNYTSDRYEYANIIALAICRHLQNLDPNTRNMLLSFLCLSKLTIVFEILQPNNQHVEDLSYLKEPLLKFITFTENKITEKPKSLCCMPPDCAIEIAKAFEFSCVDYQSINFEQIESHIVQVRKDYGYEGIVIYFLDSEYNVIGILKKKTTWYIILRAIREKIRGFISRKSDGSFQSLERKISSRVNSIKNWIGFTTEDAHRWIKLAKEFANWFDKAYHSNKINREEFNTKFPVIWNRFLTETNNTDKIDIDIKDKDLVSLKTNQNNDLCAAASAVTANQNTDEKLEELEEDFKNL